MLDLLRDWGEILGILVLLLLNAGRKIGKAEAAPVNGFVALRAEVTNLKERMDGAADKLSALTGKLTERDLALRDRFLTREDHRETCQHVHETLDRHERAIESLEGRGFGSAK